MVEVLGKKWVSRITSKLARGWAFTRTSRRTCGNHKIFAMAIYFAAAPTLLALFTINHYAMARWNFLNNLSLTPFCSFISRHLDKNSTCTTMYYYTKWYVCYIHPYDHWKKGECGMIKNRLSLIERLIVSTCGQQRFCARCVKGGGYEGLPRWKPLEDYHIRIIIRRRFHWVRRVEILRVDWGYRSGISIGMRDTSMKTFYPASADGYVINFFN